VIIGWQREARLMPIKYDSCTLEHGGCAPGQIVLRFGGIQLSTICMGRAHGREPANHDSVEIMPLNPYTYEVCEILHIHEFVHSWDDVATLTPDEYGALLIGLWEAARFDPDSPPWRRKGYKTRFAYMKPD
jgi:hypothetical protein